jgi:hypothetical protein
MARNPFVWEVQVRREVLDDELAKLRELPYTVWQDMVSRKMTKSVAGRDNRPYSLHVTAEWAVPGSPDIRVTVALEAPGLRRSRIEESFVITPDNRLRR